MVEDNKYGKTLASTMEFTAVQLAQMNFESISLPKKWKTFRHVLCFPSRGLPTMKDKLRNLFYFKHN